MLCIHFHFFSWRFLFDFYKKYVKKAILLLILNRNKLTGVLISGKIKAGVVLSKIL